MIHDLETTIQQRLAQQQEANSILRADLSDFISQGITPATFLRRLRGRPAATALVVGPTATQKFDVLGNTLFVEHNGQGELRISDPFLGEMHGQRTYSVVVGLRGGQLVPKRVYQLEDDGSGEKLLDHKKNEDLQTGDLMLEFFKNSRLI